ncbi:hypothetical protein SBRCBS47491_008357 [Sporothrix bragantina]|uniref:Major facilitator superfamily (MFS) profile domain-containing protein n=1 Tax=Sporothrix bragantina TaxID=671064 RepID=A0ABP0CKX6_9PEZI
MTPNKGGRQASSEVDPLLPPSQGSANIGYNSNGSASSSTTGAPGTTGASARRLSDASSAASAHLVTPGRGYAIAFSMWILIFLQASNMSGMTMAQSDVAADLDAYEHAMWFTSTYLIASASFAPLVGRLATVFSASHLTAVSGLCFAVGAVVTARAQTLLTFLIGRVIVGMGGAGIMTLSLIVVLQFTSKRRRGLFVGLVNAGFTVGLSTGAVVYGALLPALGWRTLFLVQAPVALLAGVGVLLSMPHINAYDGPSRGSGDGVDSDVNKYGNNELTAWQKLARIDYLGAALLTLSIVLFLYGMSGAIRLLPILISGISLLLFLATEAWYVPRVTGGDPIVPLEVLRSRGVLFSCFAQLGVMSARWTVLYYAPIYVLAVRGFPAAVAGSALIPTNLGFGSGGLVVGWLHVRRAGAFWLPSVVSLFLFACSLAVVGVLSRAHASSTGTAAYILALFANGFCTGAYLNYTLAHLLHLTRPSTHFIITSLLATFRGFSGSFGTSIGGGFFMHRLAAKLADGFSLLDGGSLSSARRTLITQLVGSPALVFGNNSQGHPALNDAEREVAVSGYESALGELYRWAAFIALLVILVQAGTGWAAPKSGPDAGTVEAGAVFQDAEEEEIREAIVEHDATMEA